MSDDHRALMPSYPTEDTSGKDRVSIYRDDTKLVHLSSSSRHTPCSTTLVAGIIADLNQK